MTPNILAVLGAAFVPLLIGMIYYHPKVLGTAWMNMVGFNEADLQTGSLIKLFGVSFIFSLMLAGGLLPLVIHQLHIYSTLMGQPGFGEAGSDLQNLIDNLMAEHGNNYRTFKHGALHGTIAALFIALPVLGINALYERKSFKYIGLHLGYWAITMAIMGGIICQFG